MHFQICGNNNGNIIHVFKFFISISVATVLEVSKMTVPICTSHWCLVMSFWLKVCIYSHTRGVKLVRKQAEFRCGYKQRLYWTENISTGEERFRGQLVWTWNPLPHRRVDGSGWHKPQQRQRRWSRRGSSLIRASGWALHYESAEDQERRMPRRVHGSLNAQRGAEKYFGSYEHWSLNETRQGKYFSLNKLWQSE